MFAPRLRSGQYMNLAEFVSTPRLISREDIRGGAGTSDSLYLQAGAFFEFLLRGPLAESRPEAIRELALLDEYEAHEKIAAVERILGASLDEIEKAWLDWGRDPPDHPKK
jgi:hypothetical protein